MKLSELSATPTGSIAAPAPPSGGATTDRTSGEAGASLSRDELLAAYRLMLLSRRLDDKEIQLKNQSQIFFQVSGAGHEAILVAAGRQMRPGEDWAVPYYRDRAFCLALGVTPYDMLLQGVGSKDDPASGGRQMPCHWGSKRLNIVSGSSPTGTQCLHGVGCAEGTLRYERLPDLAGREHAHFAGEITYVSIGEGATSEGEFWETLNTASQEKLPLVILVEDNGYAISVPVAEQTPGGDVSRLLHGFPDLFIREGGRLRLRGQPPRHGRGHRLCEGAPRPGAGPRQGHPACTRTRCRTTRSSTRRRRSAPVRPTATRCRCWPVACSSSGSPRRIRSPRSPPTWIGRSPKRPTSRWPRRSRIRRRSSSTSTRRTSIPPRTRSRPSPSPRASRTRWSRPSTRR